MQVIRCGIPGSPNRSSIQGFCRNVVYKLSAFAGLDFLCESCSACAFRTRVHKQWHPLPSKWKSHRSLPRMNISKMWTSNIMRRLCKNTKRLISMTQHKTRSSIDDSTCAYCHCAAGSIYSISWTEVCSLLHVEACKTNVAHLSQATLAMLEFSTQRRRTTCSRSLV